ncbi:MAG: hypothetical protein ACR2HG_08945 [Pyrinomonadaceae bacterium]
MAQKKDDVFNESEKDTTATGRDLPTGDGTVSDEDIDAIDGDQGDKPIGQDHSLENYEDSEPRSGVGAIQDSSLIKENIAHIEDAE